MDVLTVLRVGLSVTGRPGCCGVEPLWRAVIVSAAAAGFFGAVDQLAEATLADTRKAYLGELTRVPCAHHRRPRHALAGGTACVRPESSLTAADRRALGAYRDEVRALVAHYESLTPA